ncbi:MAG: CmcI family methyltransferase [Patescibacteria group bacterium]|nr:CmcI family methyltransferase [bacterium]MDZ4240708.1 CmcI family methyltransferase [Patescibacteria group bacterium]
MKQLLKKLIPLKLLVVYRFIKKQLRPVPEDEQVQFDALSIYNGHFNVTYKGIRTLKCPFDYVMYQMIITSLKPDLVIEIGTSYGGNALYIAELMDTIEHGKVHTIDIVGKSEVVHPRITFFKNGWEGYDLKETKKFSKILIIDDGSHMYEDVLSTLHKFASAVSVGSYYIIEDGIIDEIGKKFNGGPLRAIREFLPENKNFEVDRTYCDMFGKNATFNVNGYLKKIK